MKGMKISNASAVCPDSDEMSPSFCRARSANACTRGAPHVGVVSSIVLMSPSASRFHIGEILFSNCLRIPLILLVGIHLWEIVLYETALLAVIQFHHANIGLPSRLDQLLRCFIVTPAMHKVHHSRWQPETDSNYSSLLSVWDRIFRSFHLRDDPRTIQFGLDDFAKPEDQMLPGILQTPLKRGTRPNQ